MEKNKNSEEISIEIGTDAEEAYRTLAEWVKSVPQTINELKKNGKDEELKNYQFQVKMVLEKLKAIEKEFNE